MSHGFTLLELLITLSLLGLLLGLFIFPVQSLSESLILRAFQTHLGVQCRYYRDLASGSRTSIQFSAPSEYTILISQNLTPKDMLFLPSSLKISINGKGKVGFTSEGATQHAGSMGLTSGKRLKALSFSVGTLGLVHLK